jgi:hypothetical protein
MNISRLAHLAALLAAVKGRNEVQKSSFMLLSAGLMALVIWPSAALAKPTDAQRQCNDAYVYCMNNRPNDTESKRCDDRYLACLARASGKLIDNPCGPGNLKTGFCSRVGNGQLLQGMPVVSAPIGPAPVTTALGTAGIFKGQPLQGVPVIAAPIGLTATGATTAPTATRGTAPVLSAKSAVSVSTSSRSRVLSSWHPARSSTVSRYGQRVGGASLHSIRSSRPAPMQVRHRR